MAHSAAMCRAMQSGLFAQTLDRRVLGIDEMFRLADENSQSIQTYKTGRKQPMKL